MKMWITREWVSFVNNKLHSRSLISCVQQCITDIMYVNLKNIATQTPSKLCILFWSIPSYQLNFRAKKDQVETK